MADDQPDISQSHKQREFSIRMPDRKTLLVIIALLIVFAISYQVRLAGFQNPDGTPRWPFLRNVDSYSYYADLEDMLGGTGSFTIGSRMYQIITYFGYRLFVGSEFTAESLTHFMTWWPAFLISLAVIPAYFIGRYLYDRKAGVLSAFFVVMSPNIASRTLAGDPDSDVLVILMALISVALFAIALKKYDISKIVTKRNILYSVLAGLGVALFALTWPGYWFVFFIVVGTIVLKIIVHATRSQLGKKSFAETKSFGKAWLGFLVIFAVSFWIITAPVMGAFSIADPFSQVGISADLFGGGGIKSEAGSFPNVYVSVAELQHGGQAGTVLNNAAGIQFGAGATGIDASILGIISPIVLTILTFIYLFYSYYRRHEHLDTILVMGLWLAGMLYSAITAVRFVIFLAPVLAITSSIILSKFWNVTFRHEDVSE